MSSGTILRKLHDIVQVSFGWEEYHKIVSEVDETVRRGTGAVCPIPMRYPQRPPPTGSTR